MDSVRCHGEIVVQQYPDVCLPKKKKEDKGGQSVEAASFSSAGCSGIQIDPHWLLTGTARCSLCCLNEEKAKNRVCSSGLGCQEPPPSQTGCNDQAEKGAISLKLHSQVQTGTWVQTAPGWISEDPLNPLDLTPASQS